MLACRACRIPLSAERGCDICNGIRRNLVSVGEDEDERPGLAATGGEIVSALRARLKIVRALLKSECDDDKSAKLESRLLAIGNTAAKVLEAARKMQADGVNAVEQMSFAERAELFITWVAGLTPESRKGLRAQWDAFEVSINQPLLESKVRDAD